VGLSRIQEKRKTDLVGTKASIKAMLDEFVLSPEDNDDIRYVRAWSSVNIGGLLREATG